MLLFRYVAISSRYSVALLKLFFLYVGLSVFRYVALSILAHHPHRFTIILQLISHRGTSRQSTSHFITSCQIASHEKYTPHTVRFGSKAFLFLTLKTGKTF